MVISDFKKNSKNQINLLRVFSLVSATRKNNSHFSKIFIIDMLKTLLLIGFGGGIGSILRYLTGFTIHKFYGSTLPLATFIVNFIGCFIFGLLFTFFSKNAANTEHLRFLLLTGFCGGYTTFSTFSAENFHLFENGNYTILLVNIVASVILGVFAVFLGIQFGK